MSVAFTEAEMAEECAEAESRMLDTWTIGTDLGWTYDPDADAEVQTVTPLFTTKARIKQYTAQAAETQAGGRTVIETRRELHIPVGSPTVPANAVAQCTAVHPTTDPSVLGTIARLGGPAPGSQTTARRIEIIEAVT